MMNTEQHRALHYTRYIILIEQLQQRLQQKLLRQNFCQLAWHKSC